MGHGRLFLVVSFFMLATFELLSWSTASLPPCLMQTNHEERAAYYYDEKDCPTFFTGSLILLGRLNHFIEKNDKSIVAGFTVISAFSTIFLWLATSKLWHATNTLASDAKITAERQAAETQILQRAYISVAPLGIERIPGKPAYTNTFSFENVGHLPARNVRWTFYNEINSDRLFTGTLIIESDFKGRKNVIPPGTKIRQGGRNYEKSQYLLATDLIRRGGESFLYVWGEVRYDDGFGADRFCKFCYRYNMGAARNDWIKPDTARQHIHGNDAD